MTTAHALRRRGATAVIEGLGTSVPPRRVTNHDLAERIETSDEWVRQRTGIVERRMADPGTTTLHLSTEAAAAALKSAGGGDTDMVIVATTTPDRMCPGTAPEVASRLGFTGAAGYDVQAVCSGFVYGLATAQGLIAAGISGRIVLVGAEVITPFLNPQDRGTAVIFGDGAGALVLRAGEPDEPGALGAFDLGSDGEQSDLIAVEVGGSRQPAEADLRQYLAMDGREVYRRSIPQMVQSSQIVLEASGWSVDDVDKFVGHQANARILEAVARGLGIPEHKRVINIDRYGNTAGATIPLALADADLQAGDKVLTTAFGGGVTWGSGTFTWPRLQAA